MAVRVPYEGGGFSGQETSEERFASLWALREFVDTQVRRIVRDPHEAENLTQDTYLRVLGVLDTLERRPAAPFLATVARNLARNEVRRRVRLFAVPDVPEPGERDTDDPARVVAGAEALRRVLDALAELPEIERGRVLASALEGRAPTEIADAEGSTSGAVRTSLMRTSAKLRLVGDFVVAPVASLGTWLRRRDPDTGLRLQHSAASAGQIVTERVAQVIAVAGAAVTLSVMPLPRVSADAATPTQSLDRELAAPAAHEVVTEPLSPTAPAPHGRGTAAPDALTHNAVAATTPVTDPGRPPTPTGAPPAEGWPTPGAPATPYVDPENPPAPPEPLKHQGGAFPHDLVLVDQFSATPATDDDDDDDGIHTLDDDDEGGATVVTLGTTRGDCAGHCRIVFLSSDSGETWTKLDAAGLDEGATRVIVAPGFPEDQRMFATGASLQISRDGGATFENAAGPSGPAALSPDFSTGDPRVLLGTAPTWSYDADSGVSQPGALTPLAGAESSLAFLDRHTVLAGTIAPGPNGPKQSSVASCVDGACGAPVNLPSGTGVPGVAVVGSRTFAWIGSSLMVSGDRGASFSEVDLPVRGLITGVSGVGSRLHVAIAGISGGVHDGAVLSSLNGGLTWTVGGDNALDHGVTAVIALPEGRVLAAPIYTTGGLRCSDDGGATWAATCDD